ISQLEKPSGWRSRSQAAEPSRAARVLKSHPAPGPRLREQARPRRDVRRLSRHRRPEVQASTAPKRPSTISAGPSPPPPSLDLRAPLKAACYLSASPPNKTARL